MPNWCNPFKDVQDYLATHKEIWDIKASFDKDEQNSLLYHNYEPFSVVYNPVRNVDVIYFKKQIWVEKPKGDF